MEREEIVNALRCCNGDTGCKECSLWEMHSAQCVKTLMGAARDQMEADAAEIEHLRAENRDIRQNSVSHEVYLQVCAERDAAVKDIKHNDNCDVCKYSKSDGTCEKYDFDCETCEKKCPCASCRGENKWQWRGAKMDGDRNE